MTPDERYFKQLWAQPACGVGCVIVPPDVERQAYINRCYNTQTISILPQTGGLSLNNVPVSLEALEHIEFPSEKEKYGSVVVYLFHPKTDKAIVIAVLNRSLELFGLEWKQFKHYKSENGNYVSVVGDGKKGNLFVTVLGTEEGTGGQIWLNVNNSSNKGVLRISVQGDIQILHNNFEMHCLTTKIVSKDSFEVETETAKIVAGDTTIIDAENKVSLGKENYEPVVLGKTLKDDIIKPLLSALKTDLMVSTAMGPSGPPLPTFVTKIAEIEAKLNTILSEKVETE